MNKYYLPVSDLLRSANKRLRIFFLLLVATTALCFIPQKAKADPWPDNTQNFSVSAFNASTGTFQIVVRYGAENHSGDDHWFKNVHVDYTLDGVNYIKMYTYNNYGDPAPAPGLNPLISSELSKPPWENNIEYYVQTITIPVDNDLINIKQIRLYGGSWINSEDQKNESYKVDGKRAAIIPQMTPFGFITPTFITKGNVPLSVMGYKKTPTGIDLVSKIQLFNSDSTPAALSHSGELKETFDTITPNALGQLVFYKQGAYFDSLKARYRVSQNSNDIYIPAFPLPTNLRGYYDTGGQVVKLSWDIWPAKSDSFAYIPSDFVLQIASNSSFTNPINETIAYNPFDSSFNYDIKSGLFTDMYFRLSRLYNENTGWHLWDVSDSAYVRVFRQLDADSVKVSLQPDNTAKITWHTDPFDWLPGAGFILTKLNYTTSTQSEIKLSEADFNAGFYIDKLIATCTEYHYTLQIIPPVGSAISAWPAVAVKDSILRSDIGKLVKMAASKGYFPDRAEISWNASGAFDNFIIRRAEYGTNNYLQIATVNAGGVGSYQFDDEKGVPGTYYSYQVIGMLGCNFKQVYSKDTLYAIGFRSPTGNIYGRVRYENGQAVKDVAVRLETKDAAQLGKSIYLNGADSSYLSVDSLYTPFNDIATIEAWIKPDDSIPSGQVIISRQGQFELGFNAGGSLYFDANGVIASGAYKNDNGSFIHVAGIRTKDSVKLMLGDSVIAGVKAAVKPGSPSKGVLIGKDLYNDNFKGYIDEVRVWNKALPDSVIKRDYTRLMAGGEDGLAAYWRFDEAITDQFYDVSHTGSQYNRNDGRIYGGLHTDTIPAPSQLALKDYTDSTGNYFIFGVPYTGNGTIYTIIPLLGTHQFDPAAVSRLVSPAATEFTIDFTDKSSFPVAGHIYYKNSTVPVKGVQFKVDGIYAQQSNGNIIESDDSGKFSINVPVGYHEVKAAKANHVFVNEGKLTDRYGNNINYQDNTLNAVQISDSTTIRFAGRVAGGAQEEAYPLGHSKSKNNLGTSLTVTLTLPSGDKYDLRNGKDSTSITDHLLPSNQKDSSKIHKTRVEYNQHEIIIHPDSLTGEFVTDLIPEQFIASQVTATGWGNILIDALTQKAYTVTIDLTNKFFRDSSVYNYTDSALKDPSRPDSGYAYTNYSDTFRFNASYKFIKRVIPAVSIEQVDYNNDATGFFGDSSYQAIAFTGTKESIPTIDNAKKGTNIYLFGKPIFAQNVQYNFKIKAFEEYPYYESDDMVRDTDKVATQDGFASITNNIKNASSPGPDTLSLDKNGEGNYSFIAGDPAAVINGAVKSFSASLKFGKATFVDWKWLDGKTTMYGYITGGTLSGTDFVTQGPDKLLMVLRDPPGSASYSFAEQSSAVSNLTTYSGSVDNEGDEEWEQKAGFKLVTFVGLGAGTITDVENSTGYTVGVHHEEHYAYTNTKATTVTLTTDFQTSDDPSLVGTPADVFVGYSTNITYGSSDNIALINKKDKSAEDIVIDSSTNYMVVQRSGINLNEQFGTLFAYTQEHITTNVIPGLIKLRNNSFNKWLNIADATKAKDTANATGKAVYVSKLEPTDPNYGKSNNDKAAFGDKAISNSAEGPSYRIFFPENSEYRSDTIMTFNQFIANWEVRLAENEKAKVNSKLLQNYSFTGGSPISYSETNTKDTTATHEFSIVIGGKFLNSWDVEINKFGFEFNLEESVSTTQGGTFETTNSTSLTRGFQLASSNTNEYLSVDVKKDEAENFVFATKGGQTSCPYEGADSTQYYLPGTVLNQPTVAIEVPVLTIDQPVASNVPESRPAVYDLVLSNNSQAQLDANFLLTYQDVDSVKGATISIDGTPIGGSGRIITIPYGTTLTKVLTLTKGPNANDYNNIPMVLQSQCDGSAADVKYISAHFIPSCSDIALAAPDNNWVMNTRSDTDETGARYLPVTINKFDVNNKYFDHIELQYKPSSVSIWNTGMSFYYDDSAYSKAQGPKQKFSNASAISYNLKLDNDQNYDIRAISACLLGPGNVVTTTTGIASGIKDTYNPRLFGNPQPSDGILDLGEDVLLNFNETIMGGLLTDSKFQVTGIRNGAKSDNSVSVKLDGTNDYLSTEFLKNFTGKNITAEAWILPAAAENGTVFSQGDINNSMELAVTANNHLEVIIGAKKITSDKAVVTPGLWSHAALVYNDSTKKVSAFYNFVQVINDAPVDAYTGTGNVEFGKSISKQGNYFKGNIRDARIWGETRTSGDLQLSSHTILSGAENSLLGYYPMDEGKGNIVYDKARGSNAALTGNWATPAGKSVSFAGKGYLRMNTAYTPVSSEMDYTIELWFKGEPGQKDATLAASGRGDGTDGAGSLNTFFLGFENGLLTFTNNGYTVQADGNYLDNNWHSAAIAVNHVTGTAQLYVDGITKKYFDAKDAGGLAAPYVYLGARPWQSKDSITVTQFDRYFKGNVDEFRIWNTYLNQTIINSNNNTRLTGNELGLMNYYPFEKYYKSNLGIIEMDSTLFDQAVNDQTTGISIYADGKKDSVNNDMAPVKDRGPVADLSFDYVVNNDALIINLTESKQAIDKTVVTFKVKDVSDKNGNYILSPITWTAYIDQAPLKWSDDEFNLTKDINAPMQFESYIINKSGIAQNFTLDNIPKWLTADIKTGTVDPAGKQKITFTVNEHVNIGTYNQLINLYNTDNQTEALGVNLTVKGKQPDWSVDPGAYKYNMALYGKLRIDDVFSTSKGDMLAAFIDGKCVGVTHNTYVSNNDLWYTFLTVFSNKVKDSSIEFRIWQSSTGKTYQAIPQQTIVFSNNAIIGSSSSPVIFDGKALIYQDIELNKGWNWISFNVTNSNFNNINAAFSNGQWASGDIVKNNDVGFDQYSSTSGWIGTLPSFSNTSMYMLSAANAQTLSMAGAAADVGSTAIPLQGGRWSFISYLPGINLSVKQALAGYNASGGDVIKSQTGFAMYDEQNGWIGSLGALEAGKGYMFYRKNAGDTSFYYPVNVDPLDGFITDSDEGNLETAGSHLFATNMTMIAVLSNEYKLQPGDVVYANGLGTQRGRSKMITNTVTGSNALFFNIAAEEGEPIYFTLQRRGKIIATSDIMLSYKADSRAGSLENPFVIKMRSNKTVISAYPNPFHNTITITADVPASEAATVHEVQISIYNSVGKMILNTGNQTMYSGHYQMQWNGRAANGQGSAAGVYLVNVWIDGKLNVYKIIKN